MTGSHNLQTGYCLKLVIATGMTVSTMCKKIIILEKRKLIM